MEKYTKEIAEAIFTGKSEIELEGFSFPIKVFRTSNLRYVDLYGFRFVEQNPSKSSKWAQMAKEGKKILWVFRGREYYARIIDGKFQRLKKG